MKSCKAIAIAIIIVLAPLFPSQVLAQSAQYRQALELAKGKDYEGAYELVVRTVSADPIFYEGYVLKIALATILRKTGTEDPVNLTRVARRYAPIGSNVEQDVDRMIRLISVTSNANPSANLSVGPGNTPSTSPRESLAISPFVRKKLALVIGIGTFKDSKVNHLLFTANDAKAFSDLLQNECRFDYVKTLINDAATVVNIKTEIDKLAHLATPEDLVVIYVASHGSPEDMDTAGINYIVTFETDVENLYATAFKMDDLLNDIKKRIPAERVVAFIDTCYSGATFKEPPSGWHTSSRGLKVTPYGPRADSIQDELRRGNRGIQINTSSPAKDRITQNGQGLQQGIGRVIIAASRQDEKSWESEQYKHGFFTYFLIQGLKQHGMMSVDDLYKFVSTEVPKAVQVEQRNASQNPTMAKSIDGPVKIYLKDQFLDSTDSQSKQKHKP